MQPESSPDEVERELTARLAALDEERARAQSVEPDDFTAGLPPEAAERLRGAIEGLARLHARWPDRAEPGEAPRPFGKFVIERELGRGGHGIVFLALDPALNRRVALKIPRPELLDEPDWRRRFLREARALARLDHPGIVAVLEVGEVDSVCFIASTYCDGPDLTDWLKARKSPLRPRDAARIAHLIAEAVGHAHAHGVIHRDLKPRNILMQVAGPSADPDHPVAQPRVTDFGLAKLIEAEAELTRTGAVLGTPRYMAPEQRQARHDLVGPPADVYAIGVILDEMLIGGSVGVEGGPAGASAARGASRLGSIPRALWAIVGKCLEPGPARRYRDAAGLAADLERFLDGRRVRAAGLIPRAILAGIGRRPALATAFLAVAVLSISGFFIGPWRLGRPGRPRADDRDNRPGFRVAEQGERGRQYVSDLRLLADMVPSDRHGSTYKLSTARTLLDRYARSGPGSDLRTWEWYHFQLMLHGERKTLAGHRGAVYHLEYSRDGARLGSSGADGARVWDVASGTTVLTLREHSGDINWIAFAPEGTRLATAGDDRMVQLWSAADGRSLLPPMIHRHEVIAVLFAKDGRHLVACDRGGIVTTWDGSTGTPIESHKVSEEPLQSMDLSPDGSILAVADTHAVTLWDYPAMVRRTVRVPIDEPVQRYDCVAFSHDGRRFATSGGASPHQVGVWETRTGRLRQSFTHHADERALTVAFSPDDRFLLSTASDEAARIWDTAIGECVGVLAGHEGWVWAGAFAPDGRSAATSDGNGTIKLWSIPHRVAETSFERPLPPCLAMAYSSDEGSLFTATAAGPLEAWDPSTGSFRGGLPLRPARASVEAAFAPGARMVALADAEGTLTIGGPRKARPDFTIPRAMAARPCLTFSADGKTLAYVAGDGAVARLDVTKREPRPSALGSLPSAPTCLAFAPDGGLLAGDAEGRLFAFGGNFDAATAAAERGHRGRIRALVVAPDGSLCATGGEDASIVIWDRPALRIHARLDGHERAIDALAFTRDGRSIVSIAEGVQLWNVSTAQPTIRLATRIEGSMTPGRLAISTDGTSIAVVVREPGTLQGRVWHAARPDSRE